MLLDFFMQRNMLKKIDPLTEKYFEYIIVENFFFFLLIQLMGTKTF